MLVIRRKECIVQSSVDYGNDKITHHACTKSVIFQSVELDKRWKNWSRWGGGAVLLASKNLRLAHTSWIIQNLGLPPPVPNLHTYHVISLLLLYSVQCSVEWGLCWCFHDPLLEHWATWATWALLCICNHTHAHLFMHSGPRFILSQDIFAASTELGEILGWA